MTLAAQFPIVLSLVAVASSSAGCYATEAEDNDELVTPRVELIDHTTHALASGALSWANGTYGGNCRGRSALGTEAWSLRIAGTATMSHPALSVTKGDSDCVLTLTKLQASALYDGSSSIPMGTAYAGSPSSFTTGGGALAFYANAKLSATDMAAEFTVSIRYSDDLASTNVTSTASTAQYATGTLPAPNYVFTNAVTIGSTNGTTVTSSAGTLSLTAGTQSAETYRIIYGTVGTTYTDVSAAYLVGTGSTSASVPTSIAASLLSMQGAAVPVSRTIIMQSLVVGVASYQVIRYTFRN